MAKPTRYTAELIAEYAKKGYWKAKTLSEWWDFNAERYPQKEAIVDSRTRLTWSEAKRWIDRMALGFLEKGLKRDDLVVIQMTNFVELCLARVACEKAGVLCLPLLRSLRENDMEYILKRNKAKALVIRDEFRDYNYVKMAETIRPQLPELKEVFVVGKKVPRWAVSLSEIIQQPIEDKYPPDYLEKVRYKPTEVSLINSTTGTTGLPKFSEFTAAGRPFFGKGIVDALHLNSDDIVAGLSPAPTGPNIPTYFAAPMAGAKVIFLERFEAEEALKLLEREKVTVACLVPAQMALMLRHPNLGSYNLSLLRACWCTGAVLPYQDGKEFEEKTRAKVMNVYGGVDFGGVVAPSVDDSLDTRLLTVGKPRGFTEIKIVGEKTGKKVGKGEVGEVLGRGPACSTGYYNDLEGTRQSWTDDGWFKTGDLGKFDEQSNLVIVGRQKDMIIRGGWNIYPKEIEDILITHPKVLDVAIVGMPDPIMGERACAYIVPKQAQEIVLNEVVDFLKKCHGAPMNTAP